MSTFLNDQDLDAFIGHSASEQELSAWLLSNLVLQD